ncbi:helix-turn-helix domain-containing protein [Phenylobacterium sp.]|uniref:AraC family transcriptional regulator n=1 Tax=Phenylobacterium sp. TaxID=1871053 RepID=UPI00286D526D|nr:helix-turn-helix domain-containing protein [Phenylobacterium sp.]
MDAWPQPKTDPMDRARRHIEDNLDSRLDLNVVADAAGLSPYHFSRLFTARYGLSPIAYVRVRRLEAAAGQLRSGPRTRLIDLALDWGFDSQEGFTRAFTRTFGIAPGRYRDGVRPPRTEQLVMRTEGLPATNLTQAPAPAKKPALRIAGLGQDFDETTVAGIPALWDQFGPRLPLPGQVGRGTFGVCCARPDGQGLHYIAGVALAADAEPPPGCEVIELPARSYLVFRQVLDGGPLHPQMQSAVREIWGDRVPNCGLSLVRAPDLEVYPDLFQPDRPGAWVEWWIPVEG